MEHVASDLRYSRVADAFLALAVAGTLAIVALVPFPPEARVLVVAWALGGAAAARIKLTGTRWLRVSSDGAVEVRVRGRVGDARRPYGVIA